jgi:hypothetical protein
LCTRLILDICDVFGEMVWNSVLGYLNRVQYNAVTIANEDHRNSQGPSYMIIIPVVI